MRRALNVSIAVALIGCAFAWGLWTGQTKMWPFDPVWRIWRTVQGVPMPFPAPPRRSSGVGLDDGLIAPADVVMLGDSLSVMGRWNEYWPRLRIANRGMSGETVADLHKRLSTVFAVKPQTVVLLIGTNDVAVRGDLSRAAGTLRMLVSEISARSKLLLVTVPPCLCATEQNAAIVRLNADVRRIANQGQIPLIDLHAALLKDGAMDPTMTSDGVHLNANGYAKWVMLLTPHLPAPRDRS